MTVSKDEWFGQPRGLTILFLTDMWEQFSYYGMRTILVYYAVKQLHLSQERASLIYGFYTAFVFFTPIVGGVICDRWLGRRRSVIIGGCIMALGHFLMAFEPSFYFALMTIAVGNGLFLPSLPSQIKGLYAADDPRRVSAYNYYYAGINLGGVLAPLVVGTVGELCGWHWGFTVAGFGMVVALLTYLGGSRYLPADEPPNREARSTVKAPLSLDRGAMIRRFGMLAGIAGIAIVFRTAYEQVGNTLPLWIETSNRTVGDFTIPMTWFQSLNPLLIFVLTPLMVAHWLRRARRGRELTSIMKMALGAGITAVAYVMLAAVAAWTQNHGGQVSCLWIAAFFCVMTVGELYILPVGLGLFGRLAPTGFTATSIALWFLAGFAGNLAAGAMGTYWSTLSPAQFFLLIAGIATLSGLLLWGFERPARQATAERYVAKVSLVETDLSQQP